MAYLSDESRVFTLIAEGQTAAVIEAIEKGTIPVDHGYSFSGLDTPLIWATITGNLELVKWLLEHGADVNFQQHKYKTTALHIAARRANNDMCRLLLAHKANVGIVDKKGHTPGQLVTSTRCLAHRALAKDVKDALGVDEWAGAYRDTSQDPENVKFWGKLGPPPPMTQEDRDRERADKAARKAKKAAKRAEKELGGELQPAQ